MKKIMRMVIGSVVLLSTVLMGCSGAFGEKEHTFDEWVVTNEATCTEEGAKKHKCTGCGFEETQVIDAKGHSYDEGTITTEATCTEKGTRTFTCSACSVTKKQDIAAKGHDYDEGSVTTEPTCSEDGVKTFTCRTCSETKTESIASIGHNYDGLKCTKCGGYSVTLREIGTEYTDADGLKLTLNTFTHTESNGYNIYSINYTLKNVTPGSEIGPGIFKIIYKTSDGSYDSSFQNGFFNNLYYEDTSTRSYSWKLTSDKTFVCIEYISDSQMSSYIFADNPSDKLFNWVVE